MRNKIANDLTIIRKIRVSNNDLWMDILAIAIAAAPDQVANILAEIRVNDSAITDRLTDLVVTLREQQKRGVLAD